MNKGKNLEVSKNAKLGKKKINLELTKKKDIELCKKKKILEKKPLKLTKSWDKQNKPWIAHTKKSWGK